MSIKEFLLRVWASRRLSRVSESKIYQFIKEFNRIPSFEDLMQLLNGNYGIVSDLQVRIFSEETTNLLKKTRSIAQWITILDHNYPIKLREISQPPLVLSYQGNLDLLNTPIVAIVGARQNTQYSNEVLQQLIPPLINNQITTISGLAQGVDSLCHRLTMNYKGKTIGVIGTGIGKSYPKCNEKLQSEMMKNHLVISEYLWNEEPRAWHFPERNRIIAGLCDSIVVVEARERSGSLITANLALQENRNVLAVPGKINVSLSRGCNLLIREGAKPVLDATDILEEF